VPISAVFQRDNGEQVAWIIDSDGKSSPRPIKTGVASGSHIEIMEGLQPGDRIATAGVSFLRDGMRVRDLGDALGGG
jgi:multidrug efflux pump subunit AcrA (membrane-fusion protein)